MRQAKQHFAARPKILQTVVDTFNNYYDAEPEGEAFPISNWVNIPGMIAIMKILYVSLIIFVREMVEPTWLGFVRL